MYFTEAARPPKCFTHTTTRNSPRSTTNESFTLSTLGCPGGRTDGIVFLPGLFQRVLLRSVATLASFSGLLLVVIVVVIVTGQLFDVSQMFTNTSK